MTRRFYGSSSGAMALSPEQVRQMISSPMPRSGRDPRELARLVKILRSRRVRLFERHPGRTGRPANGRWKRVTSNGVVTAFVVCPECGSGGSLTSHEIAADGTVTPSVVCAGKMPDGGDCKFHEMIRLAGWVG